MSANDPRFDDIFNFTAAKPGRHRSKRKDLEGAVQRECLAFLRACEQVVYVERRNTGALELEGGGYICFGAKGAADIWCLVNVAATNEWTGATGYDFEGEVLLHVEIECKRRDGKGRMSSDQKDFQAFCSKTGIPYFVVTSAEDLGKHFDNAGFLP